MEKRNYSKHLPAQFRAEFECEFLFVLTLINPSKIKNMVYKKPHKRTDGLKV